jgi:hypothetical protein
LEDSECPGLSLPETEAAGATVAEIIKALDHRYPGLAGYLVDDRGALRQHVNMFIGDSLIRDRRYLQDSIASDQELFIFQAPSGGWLDS